MPGDGDPLLLAAGEGIWQVMQPVFDPSSSMSMLMYFSSGFSCQYHRQQNVLIGGQFLYKIIRLKHKPNLRRRRIDS